VLYCCRHIAPLATAEDGQTLLNDPSAASKAELKELVDSLADTQPAGALVRGGGARGGGGVNIAWLAHHMGNGERGVGVLCMCVHWGGWGVSVEGGGGKGAGGQPG
jgi:hypothetical protein